MSIAASFSRSYAEARAKFRAAAQAAGAALSTFRNPAAGPGEPICESSGLPPFPSDEALSTDIAWIGPRTATRLVYAQSGTHGVEGFCGSGIQVGWLEKGLHRDVPRDTALLLTHAINPYGFAWQRRVTEDNVDLNRNFVTHGGDYPRNAGYEALQHAICPLEWTAESIGAADRILLGYMQEHGAMALQAAITSGQYSHAQGVFYGGRSETWSNRTLIELLRAHAGGVRHVAFIDLHTGLGPYGVGEIMNNHAAGDAAFERVAQWFDREATSTEAGSSSSAPVSGDTTLGVRRALPGAEITGITLEYGTVPVKDALDAVRADNWLHAHGDLRARPARDIKAQIRAAFYPEGDDWKEMVFERSVDVLRRTLAGLGQS
ncbi:MAG TPA: M14 family metallopeptidase [Candidatus Acidoferrum sp.]|nr:M14 family metallopeptidase [Candidatus Acidoferrum sp.]